MSASDTPSVPSDANSAGLSTTSACERSTRVPAVSDSLVARRRHQFHVDETQIGSVQRQVRSLHDDDVLDDPRVEFVEHRVEINAGRNPVRAGTRQRPDARATHGQQQTPSRVWRGKQRRRQFISFAVGGSGAGDSNAGAVGGCGGCTSCFTKTIRSNSNSSVR